MALAITLQHHLDSLDVDYEVVAHPYADTGLDTCLLYTSPSPRDKF